MVVVKIDSNAFNNSNFKQIKIHIDNISIQIMHILNNSLEPIMIKHNKYYEFYETIYIENRIDINCEKTLWFMKNDIYYNFFFEHTDVNSFLNDCKNKSKLELRELFEKYDQLNETKKTNNILNNNDSKTYEIYILIAFTIILFFLTFIFIYDSRYLFKKYKPKDELKSKDSEKKGTDDHINNEVAISSLNNVELPLQEISNDLNAIINIDQLS